MEHGDEIADLLTLTTLMGGTMTRFETLNSVGRSSKKIVIEYDVEERNS